MNKHIVSTLFKSALGVAMIFLVSSQVQAETCTTQYGNGQYGTTTCVPTELTVDKEVRNPITGVYVDNLVSGDATYSIGSEVQFKLVIHNSDDHEFSEVGVTDTLPEQMKDAKVADDLKNEVFDQFYNPNTRQLTFKIHSLKAGEGREIRVIATVADRSKFEAGKGLHCDVENKAKVSAEDQVDEDSAKFCVQTEVEGVTSLPQAGPEDFLSMIPFIGTGLTGIVLLLKKRS